MANRVPKRLRRKLKRRASQADYVEESSPQNQPQTQEQSILQLQRLIGNQATMRHLNQQQSERDSGGETVQRSVYKTFRGRKIDLTTANQVAKYIKLKIGGWKFADSNFYKHYDLIADQFTEENIEHEVDAGNYLTDDVDRDAMDLAKIIYQNILNKYAGEQLEDTAEIADGVKFKISNTTAKTGGARVIPSEPSRSINLQGTAINFNASIMVDADSTDWQIGFTQTGLSVERHFKLLAETDGGDSYTHISETRGQKPANDHNPGTQLPWYSTSAFKPIQQGAGMYDVSMLDMPGEELNSTDARFTMQERRGEDHFKTWLILYNTKTKEAVFLKEWAWNVDYGNDAGIMTAVDSDAGRDVIGQPDDAILTAPRLREILLTETENIKI